jgi:drug/metabolite transporter (DMT)-like permease
MIYVIITILVFNLLIIIFKLFARFKVDNLQALIVNYITAGTIGFILSEKSINLQHILSAPWLYHAMVIGFLFIIVFNFYAFGTQKVGIAVTTVANKMSLVIPVAAAIIIYPDQQLSPEKMIGFVLALIGIYLASTKGGKLSFNIKYLWLIILVFVGQGVADSIFENSKLFLSEGEDMLYFVVLFFIAAISGLLILLGKSVASPPKFELKNIFWGVVFGIPNFFSLSFMLQALEVKSLGGGSVVFPLVSIGVVVLSSIIGLVLFKEKLTKGNWIGILFSVLAIAIFSFGHYIFG